MKLFDKKERHDSGLNNEIKNKLFEKKRIGKD